LAPLPVRRRDRRLKINKRQGSAMFEILDRRTSLTANQIKILAAAIIGDALEFFDYFLIGFVLAFLIGPWKLTFGQSATVLMSSGIGAIIGAYVWGWLADHVGRRKVFIGTVLNFSIATGLLYFTPDNGWIYISVIRFGGPRLDRRLGELSQARRAATADSAGVRLSRLLVFDDRCGVLLLRA
jgi:predicted MFS family arabinose efflux permease